MKPLAMPRVRITSVLTCPNVTCSRTIYSPAIRAGEVWMKCNVAEKQRRGGCPAHWLNITLPELAIGWQLARVTDPEGGHFWADLILSHVKSAPLLGGDRMTARLGSEPGRPVHVQIAARARDEHHLRYAPIADVLRALQIVAA